MRLTKRLQTIFHSLRAHTPFVSSYPTRVTLRFGKRDLPNAVGIGKRRSLAEFQKLIVETVHACGPITVRCIVDDAIEDKDVDQLVRFAHRLGCSTELILTGEGINEEIAKRYSRSGVDWIWLTVGGVSDEVHRASTGLDIESTTESILTLLAVRKTLVGRPEDMFKLGFLMPWVGDTPNESSAIRAWAKELGVDTVHLQLPYNGRDVSTVPVPDHPYLGTLLTMVLQDNSDKPGWKRRYPWSCPVGDSRFEVSKYGRVCACPHKKPVLWERESFLELWTKLKSHRGEVQNCDRVCLNRELRFL